MTTFNGSLDVTISDARNLEQQHLSRQDPYCVLTLGSSGAKSMMEGSGFMKETYKTKVQNGAGQHPVWNESHTFNLKNMKLDSRLKVKLYDRDTIKDDYIGVATITLQELLRFDKQGVSYFPLFQKVAKIKETNNPIGQVGIAVAFNCTEIPQWQADTKSQVRDVAMRGQGQHLQQGQQMQGQQMLGTGQQQGYPSQATQGTQFQGQGTQFQGQQGLGQKCFTQGCQGCTQQGCQGTQCTQLGQGGQSTVPQQGIQSKILGQQQPIQGQQSIQGQPIQGQQVGSTRGYGTY